MTTGNVLPEKSVILGKGAEAFPSPPGDVPPTPPPAINPSLSSAGPGAALRLEHLGGCNQTPALCLTLQDQRWPVKVTSRSCFQSSQCTRESDLSCLGRAHPAGGELSEPFREHTEHSQPIRAAPAKELTTVPTGSPPPRGHLCRLAVLWSHVASVLSASPPGHSGEARSSC